MQNASLKHLIPEAERDFAACANVNDLEQAKAKYLGKAGALTEAMKGLGKLSNEERPAAGAAINVVKQAVEAALKARRDALLLAEQEKQLAGETLDVTLPARSQSKGGLHPVSLTLARLEALFHSIGFDVAEGPEIESDFYNFTALNIPDNHPARAMHDTFYVDAEDGSMDYVLRTHTSPVQIHYMQDAIKAGQSMPLKIIAPGRVYRVDSDATHSRSEDHTSELQSH